MAALSACDSQQIYPFVAKWQLDNPNPQDLCTFMPAATITRRHITMPLSVLTITEIKSDKGRWVLNVTGNSGASPPVVVRDVCLPDEEGRRMDQFAVRLRPANP